MNFKKLRQLISECESQREQDQRDFFIRLKNIAETELSLKQEKLSFWGE